jgi:hypothetical protein
MKMMKIGDDELTVCFSNQEKKENIDKVLRDIREFEKKRRGMMWNLIIDSAIILTGTGAIIAMGITYELSSERICFQAVIAGFTFIVAMKSLGYLIKHGVIGIHKK